MQNQYIQVKAIFYSRQRCQAYFTWPAAAQHRTKRNKSWFFSQKRPQNDELLCI